MISRNVGKSHFSQCKLQGINRCHQGTGFIWIIRYSGKMGYKDSSFYSLKEQSNNHLCGSENILY